MALAIALLLMYTPGARALGAQTTLAAGDLRVTLSASGAVTSLRNATTNREYLSHDTSAALLTVVHNGQRVAPSSLSAAGSGRDTRLTLKYPSLGATVIVRAQSHAAYVALEIVNATPAAAVDAVIWGPYPTTISRTIGEIIGVVRDSSVALGLQVLNLKTLGGDLPNREGSTWARGIAALAKPWGSSISAYAIDRSRPRTVDAWGGNFADMPVAPIPGETVVGSAIALFTCAEPRTFAVLEAIEVAEHLPHPTIAGVWFPKSPLYERSYLISSFGESDVDEMIAYTKRAGLMSLYHEGPFKSWGHFVLNDAQFPNGRRGLKLAVDKAHEAGLHFGVHTLTNFINTNDPYVTPVPDDRLSVTGTSTLASAIDATQRTIPVQSPTFFAEQKNNSLHTVKIGHELIQYRAVSLSAPFQLLDCQRGAFGTTASAHAAGETVGKLFDHPYNVFFPNFAMQREVAKNLADLLNETGVDHLDFDGHEGALASGQGDYALGVFANDVMTQTKHDLIMGTSISKTVYWHIGSYYNWGEPWNGGFTESMQQYRIDNQALFDRNFMPHMLGWYLLTESTTMADMEWMLARSAGYGAGFAMVARPKALRNNPISGALLDAIREWERARMTHAFSEVQRARLKDPRNEFHLAPVTDGEWTLSQVLQSPVFTHTAQEKQPGEPTASRFSFDQSWSAQPLQFRLTAVGAPPIAGVADTMVVAERLVVGVDGFSTMSIDVALRSGESVFCDGTTVVRVFDRAGKVLRRITLLAVPPTMAPGAHTITLDASFRPRDAAGSTPSLALQLRGLGPTERVRGTR